MADIKFCYGTPEQLEHTEYTEGSIYFIAGNEDEIGKIYLDMKQERKLYTPEYHEYDDAALRQEIEDLRGEIPEAYDDTEIRQQIEEVRSEIPEVPEQYDDTAIQERIDSLAEEHTDFNTQIASLEAEKQALNNQVSDLEFTNGLLAQRVETLMQMFGCIPHEQTELKQMSASSENDDLTSIPRNGNTEPFDIEMVFSDGEGNYSIRPAEAQLMDGYDKNIPTRGSYLVTLDDGIPRVVEGLDKPATTYELRSEYFDVMHFVGPLHALKWQAVEMASPSYNSYPREYRNFIENCLPTKSVMTRLEFGGEYAGLYALVIHDRTYGAVNDSDNVVALECRRNSQSWYGGEQSAFRVPYSDNIWTKMNGDPMTEEQIAAYEEWRQSLLAAIEDPEAFDEFVHTRCYYDNLMEYIAYNYLVWNFNYAGEYMLMLTYDNFQHVLFSINPNAPEECYGVLCFNGRTPGGSVIYDERYPLHREEDNVLFNTFSENYKAEAKQWLAEKTANDAILNYPDILSYIQEKINMVGAEAYAEQRASDSYVYKWADHFKYSYFEGVIPPRWEWVPENFAEPEPSYDDY